MNVVWHKMKKINEKNQLCACHFSWQKRTVVSTLQEISSVIFSSVCELHNQNYFHFQSSSTHTKNKREKKREESNRRKHWLNLKKEAFKWLKLTYLPLPWCCDSTWWCLGLPGDHWTCAVNIHTYTRTHAHTHTHYNKTGILSIAQRVVQ